MALPHLVKYVYTHGTDEVIRRGKKIHAIGYVELIEHDELMNAAVFRVKDDNYNTFYKVYIQKYNDPKSLALRCSCPYNLGDICRHEAAALPAVPRATLCLLCRHPGPRDRPRAAVDRAPKLGSGHLRAGRNRISSQRRARRLPRGSGVEILARA